VRGRSLNRGVTVEAVDPRSAGQIRGAKVRAIEHELAGLCGAGMEQLVQSMVVPEKILLSKLSRCKLKALAERHGQGHRAQADGITISKRQVVRLLNAGQDTFLEEARDVLRAGLASAAGISVDDTGAPQTPKQRLHADR
jgi:hypothetical protein